MVDTGITLRRFREGDELPLWRVFHDSVHGIACRDYTPEQCLAWAPHECDEAAWIARYRAMRPFVAQTIDGTPVGYADLRPDGYIDHFFVSPAVARRGVGSLLMRRVHDSAHERSIPSLWAQVSRTAQPFFRKWGFEIEQHQTVTRRGVELENARMSKRLRTQST